MHIVSDFIDRLVPHWRIILNPPEKAGAVAVFLEIHQIVSGEGLPLAIGFLRQCRTNQQQFFS